MGDRLLGFPQAVIREANVVELDRFTLRRPQVAKPPESLSIASESRSQIALGMDDQALVATGFGRAETVVQGAA